VIVPVNESPRFNAVDQFNERMIGKRDEFSRDDVEDGCSMTFSFSIAAASVSPFH
jgi:hypothetical protein